MYEEAEGETTTTDKGDFGGGGGLKYPPIAHLRVVNSKGEEKNRCNRNSGDGITTTNAVVVLKDDDIALNMGENIIRRFSATCTVDLVENMPVNIGLGFIKLISGCDNESSVLLNGTPLRPRMGELLKPKDAIHFRNSNNNTNRWFGFD